MKKTKFEEGITLIALIITIVILLIIINKIIIKIIIKLKYKYIIYKSPILL